MEQVTAVTFFKPPSRGDSLEDRVRLRFDSATVAGKHLLVKMSADEAIVLGRRLIAEGEKLRNLEKGGK